MKGASQQDVDNLRKAIEEKELVIVGGELQVYAIKNDEIFEVTNDLKKVGKIEYDEDVEK